MDRLADSPLKLAGRSTSSSALLRQLPLASSPVLLLPQLVSSTAAATGAVLRSGSRFCLYRHMCC
mgnify:CR=1 FL=1